MVKWRKTSNWKKNYDFGFWKQETVVSNFKCCPSLDHGDNWTELEEQELPHDLFPC